ncbi:hypothetical protein GH714_008111 [Hevea brasiliensis]|uniref:Uncharacterized protein n=1 Tax=Hevea brasiliensis TaxID=3981 RepID=A0A6A6K5V5_HEVBR|nr:hypothetical protein GH714_008111 [Hevea brasiliensis]
MREMMDEFGLRQRTIFAKLRLSASNGLSLQGMIILKHTFSPLKGFESSSELMEPANMNFTYGISCQSYGQPKQRGNKDVANIFFFFFFWQQNEAPQVAFIDGKVSTAAAKGTNVRMNWIDLLDEKWVNVLDRPRLELLLLFLQYILKDNAIFEGVVLIGMWNRAGKS